MQKQKNPESKNKILKRLENLYILLNESQKRIDREFEKYINLELKIQYMQKNNIDFKL